MPPIEYNEADTRAKLIDPALYHRGWTEDLIRREVTAGSIEIISGKARRRGRGKADYVMRYKLRPDAQPVAFALIEAKRNTLPAGHGLDQAKGYAACNRLHVRFVYSSNGYQFVEFDRETGLTSNPFPIDQFPTPEDLRARYEASAGFTLDDPAAAPLLQTYHDGEGTRRYYQDAAIRAVLEKVARCEQLGKPSRALLSLATGAGKTFISVNLLKRIADAGLLKRALFLCDRDELRTQGLKAFQNVFGSDAAEVFRKNGENNAKNARIHVATYQTLGVDKEDGDASFLTEFYPENYFTHIVIDECHRSAWGKWSEVLTKNPDAVQVGLTATPRKLAEKIQKKAGKTLLYPVDKIVSPDEQLLAAERIDLPSTEMTRDAKLCADNYNYFGDPVYEYDMAQAIEDGYLAACQIQHGRVSVDETGITKEDILARNPRDAITGEPITAAQLDELYRRHQYENRILLPDRVLAMCQDLFNYLLETGGPEQKTIIFCARDRHADDVAAQLNNLYANWCKENGKERLDCYAFKCTAASSGNDQLPDLRAASRSHFIATTVDLLSTGVDVPCVRNIAFMKYIKSPISFYQMVGRGTRIDIETNKLMFTVYDYTEATKLFGEEFISNPPGEPPEGPGPDDPPPRPPPEPTIIVDGFDVHITDAGRSIVTEVDGKAMPVPVEEYRARLAAKLIEEAHTLEEFRAIWIDPPTRQELIHTLVSAGYSPSVVRMVDDKDECDLYDVLAELGWGLNPRTRQDRALAFTYKNEEWLDSLPEATGRTIKAIAGQFRIEGTEALENRHIFDTPEVALAGGLKALRAAGEPNELLRETKVRMFAA